LSVSPDRSIGDGLADRDAIGCAIPPAPDNRPGKTHPKRGAANRKAEEREHAANPASVEVVTVNYWLYRWNGSAWAYTETSFFAKYLYGGTIGGGIWVDSRNMALPSMVWQFTLPRNAGYCKIYAQMVGSASPTRAF
jgi:hypothetical protein